MKYTLLKAPVAIACLALVAGPFSAKADTTILVSSFDSVDFTNTRGILRADGSIIAAPPPPMGIVSIGYFGTLSNATIGLMHGNLTPANIALLAADWIQFGTSSVIGPNFGVDSTYDFSTTGNLMAGSNFNGKNVYTFIGNALTYGASTEVLVYNHATTFVQEAPLGGPPKVEISVDQTDNVGSDGLLLGWFGSSPSSQQPGGLLLNPMPPFPNMNPAFGLEGLFVIPEPSRALMALVGFGLCFIRRRR